jgi:hypothetical protein
MTPAPAIAIAATILIAGVPSRATRSATIQASKTPENVAPANALPVIAE